MASITFAVSEELKQELSQFLWINLSELTKLLLLLRLKKFEEIRRKLEPPEEKELIGWSVELGRKAKKDSFKKLLSELPTKKREELLKHASAI
jgi:hypothetical protein